MTKAQQFQYILEPRNETGGSRLYLDCGAHVLGRSDDADVVLDHDGISRTHCRITVFPDGGVSIEDLGSTNGTFVDDKPVQSCALEGPCELALGKTRYSLQPQRAADLALLGSGKLPGSPRPSQSPSPTDKTLRPNAEISMWEQVVRCWPRTTQGDDAYVPVLTALQQSLQANGLQLRDQDSTHILAQCGGTSEEPQMLAQSDRLQLWGWDVAQLATSLPKLLAALPAPTSAIPGNPAAESESDIVGPGIGTSNPKLLDAVQKARQSRRQ